MAIIRPWRFKSSPGHHLTPSVMSCKSLSVMSHIVMNAFFGIVAGIILGFVFGFLIAHVTQLFAVEEYEAVPVSLGVFLGMGGGAMVGGIFGGIVGYKK